MVRRKRDVLRDGALHALGAVVGGTAMAGALYYLGSQKETETKYSYDDRALEAPKHEVPTTKYSFDERALEAPKHEVHTTKYPPGALAGGNTPKMADEVSTKKNSILSSQLTKVSDEVRQSKKKKKT